MTTGLRTTSSPQFLRQAPAQRLIFVSYCHADHQDCRELVKHLKPACELLGDTSLWVDFDAIQGGDRWRATITDGLARAQVYIVLMSQDYRASTFCMQDELAPILRKVQQRQALVIPIALHEVKLADFSADDGAGGRLQLQEIQCLPQGQKMVDGQERLGLAPISKWMGDRRDAWHAVRTQIDQALGNSKPAGLRHLPSPPAQQAREADQAGSAAVSKLPDSRRLELPYLCNRVKQSSRLGRQADALQAQGWRRPWLITTEGQADDRLDKWAERLAVHELVQTIAAFDSQELSFKQGSFNWPLRDVQDAEEARGELVMDWNQCLHGKRRLVPEAELHLHALQSPLPWLLHSDLDLTRAEPAALQHAAAALAGLLGRWPDSSPQHLLVVALNLHHGTSADPVRAQAAQALRQALDQAAALRGFGVAHLGALPEVASSDLAPWANLPSVQPLLPRGDLETLRERLEQPQRMKQFAKLYDHWYDECTQGTGRT